MLITFLNLFAPIAFTIFFVGLGLKLGRLGIAMLTRRWAHGVTRHFEGAPPTIPVQEALGAVVINPINHFYRRANPGWGRGYIFYHMAIITEVIGYSISAVIVAVAMLMGRHVPDVALHTGQSFNYEPANLLALVFGNAEPLQASFLFGSLGPLFTGFTWVVVLLAVVGNFNLLRTLLSRRNAAVVRDIDPAARGLRIKGRISWDRLVVRLLIFCIIWTELLTRLEVIPGMVYVHAALGLVLFTLFPFTYLFHMVYSIIAVAFATRRRMVRTLA